MSNKTIKPTSSTTYHILPTTYQPAFTIVELLVVIVVIGILAAITIVSYTGISSRATVASLQSDLSNAKKQLALYQVEHSAFPTSPLSVSGNSYCPSDDSKYCFKSSSSATFTYANVLPSTFSLKATNSTSTTAYSITNSSQPTAASATCPTGFIPVPGSSTYGTNDFCVMKYEAKQVGTTTTPISEATGTPWVSIDQPTAIANSPNVANCTGCHLITEAEWLTIAQNVLSVNTNWSGSTVGTGCIFRGNVGALDACGYDGANPEFGTGRNAKASLTLSNNQVIWDLSGNVYEWTSGTLTTGQPGGAPGAGYAMREWTAITNPGTLSLNVFPSGTDITGASGWNSGNGIGGIYSSADEAGLRGFLRGGYWNTGGTAGVLMLDLDNAPSDAYTAIGFRVASP